LVTNATGGMIVYDLSSAEVIACVRDVHGLDRTSPVIFAHGGRAALVGCKGGQVQLFDAGSARSLQTLNHDGKHLICLTTHLMANSPPQVEATFVHWRSVNLPLQNGFNIINSRSVHRSIPLMTLIMNSSSGQRFLETATVRCSFGEP
jgi:hypothetical protein